MNYELLDFVYHNKYNCNIADIHCSVSHLTLFCTAKNERTKSN